MTLEERIESLTKKGLAYDDKKRCFIREKGNIDHDIVVYGTDLLFEKHLKKLKI